ncbi:hypothetical protein N9U90_02905 [Candidatus Pelagibacter sp.]|nr:hypothetical protein [Candidatus Pelagibacter sp.]
MNKIKQNKITFILILSVIAIIFTSLTILSLPVLFNYKSKVTKIEKNFYKNFKIYMNSSGKISYKPFPKPHLLVENALLDLSNSENGEYIANSSNLKIYITLRDVYLRSFDNFLSTEISNTNLEFKISNLVDLRKHLYQKVNRPIILNNCKIFIRNKNNEVIIISPIKKASYKINNKIKVKNFTVDGELFGLNFKSEWKRNYETPKKIYHKIDVFNPIIEIKNIFEFEKNNNFNGNSSIAYGQEKLEYNINFDNNNLIIYSPNQKNTNFNLNSKIQINPFYFDGELIIKNKKVEKIIDLVLLNLLMYNQNYLGNFNGLIKVKFNNLQNKLIKQGELDLIISEKKINLKEAKFQLDKIGKLKTNISFKDDKGDIKFLTKNKLILDNHIEFAKIFQVGTRKVKNIKEIHFDLVKNIGETDFTITNVKIDNEAKNSNEIYLIKNIQNLRSYVREVID